MPRLPCADSSVPPSLARGRAPSGALQALFLIATCDAAASADGTAHMTLAQLKAVLALAKVVGHGGVAADALDRVYAAVLSTPRALARWGLVVVALKGAAGGCTRGGC